MVLLRIGQCRGHPPCVFLTYIQTFTLSIYSLTLFVDQLTDKIYKIRFKQMALPYLFSILSFLKLLLRT